MLYPSYLYNSNNKINIYNIIMLAVIVYIVFYIAYMLYQPKIITPIVTVNPVQTTTGGVVSA